MIPSRWPIPKKACDTHIHIYDLDKFPLKQTSAVSPPHVNWTDYDALRQQLGTERTIIVQPMGYGFDNACTLDALQQSQGSARAVISAPSDNTPTALEALDHAGWEGFLLKSGQTAGR